MTHVVLRRGTSDPTKEAHGVPCCAWRVGLDIPPDGGVDNVPVVRIGDSPASSGGLGDPRLGLVSSSVNNRAEAQMAALVLAMPSISGGWIYDLRLHNFVLRHGNCAHLVKFEQFFQF